MISFTEKHLRVLLAIFVMVFSIFVLSNKVPENRYIKSTIESLEESKNTVMEFSGATLATSLAISALPDDFASPFANTLADMNKYFILIFAVLFVEKLIVLEGIRISFTYIIPAACVLYIVSVFSGKEIFKSFAMKLTILGMAVVLVIPFSTHFTERVCSNYLEYVDETIEEADAGASKVNEVMASGDENATIFDKLSDAFKTAIRGVSDLLEYFKNVVKRCVNSIAIMIVTTCVLPILILFVFKWLLKELFSLNLSIPTVKIRAPKKNLTKAELAYKETDYE